MCPRCADQCPSAVFHLHRCADVESARAKAITADAARLASANLDVMVKVVRAELRRKKRD